MAFQLLQTTSSRLIGASAVAASVTGTTVETVLATIAIPAGIMAKNGALRFQTDWTITNSANIKTLRTRLGGIGGAAFLDRPCSALGFVQLTGIISNRNSASLQFGSSQGGRGNDAVQNIFNPVTGAIDTSVAQDLVISAQLVNSSETATLERYLVELLS